MKTKFTFQTILLAFALCCINSVFAQAPEKMNFQTVVRDNSNKLVVSKTVGVRISILQGSANGTVVHSESKSEMTNSNGLISTEISTGNLNWATGPYFLKTELDPAGGTDYSISGTTELLSVPYALYAQNSGEAPGTTKGDMKYWDGTNWVLLPAGQPNQVLKVNSTNIPHWQTETSGGGKTYIIIEGNITNAQAATQIANELGNDTQFIWIQNTTALTSIDLSMVSQLISLKIYNNTALNNINFGGLTNVIDELTIEQNPLLIASSFPLLKSIGTFKCYTNSTLSSLSFPSLTTIDGLRCSYNKAFTSLSMPLLATSLGLHFEYNPLLTTLSFPVLTKCDLSLSDDSSFTTLSLPVLMTGSLSLQNEIALTTLSLPALTTGDLNLQNEIALTTLSLPVLKTCNWLNLYRNNALTTLSLPVLTSLGNFNCFDNSTLTSINLPALSTYGGSSFSSSNNALPSSQINALLAKFVSMGNTLLHNIDLQSQTPPAPPTGQGILDKATLIAAGKYVMTD